MFVRLTYVQFVPENASEAKRIYMEQVAPVVRRQKGNLVARLLEPTELSDDFISLTEWETEADADAYEASGKYKELVGLVKDYLTKPPVLKTFTAIDVPVATA
jgi:heme-degrading monooxygenase HmoA